MRYFWCVCSFLFLTSFSFAQNHALTISLRETHAAAPLYRPLPVDTLRVLAVMVEFQNDNDDRTTGNGSFQLTGSPLQIDPPPHDTTYFRSKIRFIENYFRKVSNGILTVSGSLLPQKILLSKTMSSYSPLVSANDNRKLAELAQESWSMADTAYPGISFSRYDVFVLFHAGAGRDINFTSTLGYDPAPFDIPSLYMDSAAFAAALGQNSFPGISVHDGFIKNTLILPETESRDVSGTLLQLSINGLFAASIGSALGLPDLFDTKTGRSGIGQFGLMDGAAIFAYDGLFPPEPSAWEKIFLGWVKPLVIENTLETLHLPAVGLIESGQDTIYKIPISTSEYFLLENRSRDPQQNGQTLTIAQNTTDVQRTFMQDTAGFRYYETSGIHGSVVDVEDFDWAVIGDMDGSTRYDGGGICIWHIDEKKIQEGLQTNSVNADMEHRGVELKEADGSKDIGQEYEMLTAGSGTENGSPLDCWFANNTAAVYKNIFDAQSFPNSSSRSGSATFIRIKDFSPRSARMQAVVERDTAILQRYPALNRSFTMGNAFPAVTKNHHVYIPAAESLFAFQSNGANLVPGVSGVLSDRPCLNGAAVSSRTGEDVVAGVHDTVLTIFRLSSPNAQGAFDGITTITKTGSSRFTTSPCFLDTSILAGTESGLLIQYNFFGEVLSTFSAGGSSISAISVLPVSPAASEWIISTNSKLYTASRSVDLPNTASGWMLASAVSPGGNFAAAAEKNGQRIIAFDAALSQKLFEISENGSPIQDIAAADIDGDGEKDIVVQSAARLSVYSRLGVLLNGFPIQLTGTKQFAGIISIADINNDAKPELIGFTSDGAMRIYNQSGSLLPGYPVQVASAGSIYPALFTTSLDTIGILALSGDGSVNAFRFHSIASPGSLLWWQYGGNEAHQFAEVSQTAFRPPSAEFMPAARVYNWPNPVYGSSTHIRCYTTEDAEITVVILDITGIKITELKGRGKAGMDSEIPWDVSNIQSGVYLARIEAHGTTRTETSVIKIAVVK